MPATSSGIQSAFLLIIMRMYVFLPAAATTTYQQSTQTAVIWAFVYHHHRRKYETAAAAVSPCFQFLAIAFLIHICIYILYYIATFIIFFEFDAYYVFIIYIYICEMNESEKRSNPARIFWIEKKLEIFGGGGRGGVLVMLFK